jgi:GNAT superfamily N-acetyltransferase
MTLPARGVQCFDASVAWQVDPGGACHPDPGLGHWILQCRDDRSNWIRIWAVSDSSIDVGALGPGQHDDVRTLILSGLGEHWGSIDDTLNPDLTDIAASYAAGRTLVACDGRRVVGTGTLIPRDGATAEIVRVSVAAPYRRAGVGRRLVADLVDTARHWRMQRVILETSAHWNEVVEFYERCGFTLTHFEDGDTGRDAWFELSL